MKITLWGTLGSYPLINNTNHNHHHTSCVSIEDNEHLIILDAGTGLLNLANKTKSYPKHIHLFFSHFHLDHIAGLPYFPPLHNASHTISLYHPDINKLNTMLNSLFNTVLTPFDKKNIKAKLLTKTPPKQLDSTLAVETFKLNHPGDAYSYKFKTQQDTIIYSSDHEIKKRKENYCLNYLNFLKNATILIHDCQYNDQEKSTKTDWGHSFVTDVLNVAEISCVKHLILTHHNPHKNSDRLIKKIKSKCSKKTYPLSCKLGYDNLIINLKNISRKKP